ncbi:MAG: hypothetical protein AAF717_06105 [Bacteroidota bacterium]
MTLKTILMFTNHFKISIRNLWKDLTRSSLNTIGLSIGVPSALTVVFSVYACYTIDNTIPVME